MRKDIRKMAQALFDTIWNSTIGCFIFWSCLLLTSRFMGFDLSHDFPKEVYIVLVFVTGVGWGIFYFVEKIIRVFIPDDSSMRYLKAIGICSMIVSILMWLSFCLILSARPTGVISFTVALFLTGAIFTWIILARNIYRDRDKLIAAIKDFLGFEDDDDDDDDLRFYK